jgi:gamma-glutamylputrescine oxidase
VVVVGGGVTGCACALALAEGGVRVRLHEARQIAGGASGRNGGFALRGTAAPYDVALDSVGGERGQELWLWTERGLDRLEALASDAFRRTGSLRLAADEEERDELLREYHALRTDGFAVEWLDDLDPPLEGRFPGAILHPVDAVLQPGRWVRRLAVAAAEAGVEIREQSRVESLDDAGSEHVVVATDGYPSGLLGELEGLIVPTRGQMIATEPLGELVFERPHYGRNGFDYWHQRLDGQILAGGFRDFDLSTEFTDVEETTPQIQEALERFVLELVGRPLRITHRWAGIFGLVPDFLPVVGRVPDSDHVWVAGGYSGHGNVLGLLCGELVADAILGREAPFLDLFDPGRLLA